MQSTQFVNELMTWPKIKVVGVPKDDLGAQSLQFLLANCLDRTRSSHGHKNRSSDFAMGCRDFTQSCLGVGIGGNEFEAQSVSCGSRVQA